MGWIRRFFVWCDQRRLRGKGAAEVLGSARTSSRFPSGRQVARKKTATRRRTATEPLSGPVALHHPARRLHSRIHGAYRWDLDFPEQCPLGCRMAIPPGELSQAVPPVHRAHASAPAKCTGFRPAPLLISPAAGTRCRGAAPFLHRFRGCRCARPPANGRDPSGINRLPRPPCGSRPSHTPHHRCGRRLPTSVAAPVTVRLIRPENIEIPVRMPQPRAASQFQILSRGFLSQS